MHFQSFDSPIGEHPLADLAPSQAALTWGSNWVRWLNLDARPPLVEFGYVLSAQQVADLEPESPQAAELVAARLAQGYLFGMAFSLLSPEGELDTTPKAYVWPIEGRLFTWAEAAGWNVNDLDEAGRFLLNLAFQSHRLHWLGQQETTEETPDE